MQFPSLIFYPYIAIKIRIKNKWLKFYDNFWTFFFFFFLNNNFFFGGGGGGRGKKKILI